MLKKIYLDMDGVLCDFLIPFFAYSESSGLPITHALDCITDPKDQRLFYYVIERNIFADLPKMPDTDLLINEIASISTQYDISIELLSSLNASNEKMANMIANQKLNWLKKHKIHYPANFVWISHQKEQFAKSSRLLIDDNLVPLQAFQKAGGIVIEHTSAEKTLISLNNMLN